LAAGLAAAGFGEMGGLAAMARWAHPSQHPATRSATNNQVKVRFEFLMAQHSESASKIRPALSERIDSVPQRKLSLSGTHHQGPVGVFRRATISVRRSDSLSGGLASRECQSI